MKIDKYNDILLYDIYNDIYNACMCIYIHVCVCMCKYH